MLQLLFKKQIEMKFLTDFATKKFDKEIVMLRLDLNVETADDSWKLRAAFPTIHWLLQRRAKIVIVSHRGRPKKVCDPALSLKSIGALLQKELFTPITFLPFHHCDDPTQLIDWAKLQQTVTSAPSASVFLMENIRFAPGEETNDDKLARQLAALGTMYVNDAFAVSHRNQASVVAITKHIPSCVGPLFEKEYKTLKRVKEQPKQPLVFVLGGAKTPEKMGLIKYFIEKADRFLVGGVVGNTFLKASGANVGDSMVDELLLPLAHEMLATGKVVVPEDWLIENKKILDIGPKTIKTFTKYIKSASTIIWSGPMGVTENPSFAEGTIQITNAIIQSKAFSVAGGGDTTQFLFTHHLEHQLSFLSTGGGAMLEFLAGKTLPGIEALE